MLQQSKTTTYKGLSIQNGRETARFEVTVPSDLNSSPQIMSYVTDGQLYKANLEAVWKDEDEFRNFVRKEEKKLYEPESDKAEEAPTSEVTETEEAPDNTSTATAATVTTKQD